MEAPLPPTRAVILEPGASLYRPYKGEIKGMIDRTLAIILTDFISRIKNIWIIILEILAWLFAIVPTMFLLYFLTSLGSEFEFPIFAMYYSSLFIWLTLICTVGGSRLISDDLANNSLTLYLSRPIKRETYFFGKFASIFLLISTISLLPSIIMAGLVIGFTTGGSDPSYDVTAVALTFISVGFLVSLVFSSIAMAFSSLTKNHLYAGVGIFCTILFSSIIPGILSIFTENEYISLFSVWNNLTIVADKWSGFGGYTDIDWPIPLLIIFNIIIVCCAIAWYRISKSELAE